jgi:protein-S-isoprenylcysteine O-methyltransferase Ste14
MTLWGVGPWFAMISVLCYLGAFWLQYHYSNFFTVDCIPLMISVIAGGVLLAVGLPFWFISARTIVRGFNEGRLVTDGVYSIVRHPLYASFMVCIAPAVALFFRSLILLAVPVVMYVVFRILIRREEDYLERTFGTEYHEYRSRVNAVFPFPRLW